MYGIVLSILETLQKVVLDNIWLTVTVIIIPLIVGVATLFLYDYYIKPQLVFIATNRKKVELGFKVAVRKKEVEKAIVKCNNIKYKWEKDGEKYDEVDLRVGDSATIFPFTTESDFVENLDLLKYYLAAESASSGNFSGGVLLQVKEPASGKIIFQTAIAVPIQKPFVNVISNWDTKESFEVRVRVIGSGLRDETEYILRVGLGYLLIHPIIEGKPLMEYIEYGFAVKSAKKVRYRTFKP